MLKAKLPLVCLVSVSRSDERAKKAALDTFAESIDYPALIFIDHMTLFGAGDIEIIPQRHGHFAIQLGL